MRVKEKLTQRVGAKDRGNKMVQDQFYCTKESQG